MSKLGTGSPLSATPPSLQTLLSLAKEDRQASAHPGIWVASGTTLPSPRLQALQTASPRPSTALKQTPWPQEAHRLLSTYTHTHTLLTRTPRSITRNPGPALTMDHTRNFTSLNQLGPSGSILHVRVPRVHKTQPRKTPGCTTQLDGSQKLRSPPLILFPCPSLQGENRDLCATLSSMEYLCSRLGFQRSLD